MITESLAATAREMTSHTAHSVSARELVARSAGEMQSAAVLAFSHVGLRREQSSREKWETGQLKHTTRRSARDYLWANEERGQQTSRPSSVHFDVEMSIDFCVHNHPHDSFAAPFFREENKQTHDCLYATGKCSTPHAHRLMTMVARHAHTTRACALRCTGWRPRRADLLTLCS